MNDRDRRRVRLPEITLCAAASVNVAATMRALVSCLDHAEFGRCLLFTDAGIVSQQPEIEVISIPRLASSAAYSRFVLADLVDYVETSHCLIAQWDGHVLSADRWSDSFLEYDYVGASWPQFDDGFDVGNGGFSLRSQRLMALCRAPEFQSGHPEDVAICRTNRVWLERQGMRFAPLVVADQFSSERTGEPGGSFGFHGGFNIPRALGINAFWDIYRQLDDYSSLKPDFVDVLWSLRLGCNPVRRMAQMIIDRLRRW